MVYSPVTSPTPGMITVRYVSATSRSRSTEASPLFRSTIRASQCSVCETVTLGGTSTSMMLSCGASCTVISSGDVESRAEKGLPFSVPTSRTAMGYDAL